MAFEYTSLPAAGADRSSEHGAYYKILTTADLTQNVGSVLKLGEGTTVFIDAAIGVVSRSGTLECDSLTFVANSPGGRIDFNHFLNGGSRGKRIQFIYQGSGSIYNHLEPIGMLQDTEQAEFVFSMTTGTGYVQFERREYQGVKLTFLPTHTGAVQFYVARSHNGQTDLPGFGVIGSAPASISIRLGTTNSRGRILDPVYTQNGVVDNYYDLRTLETPTADPILGWETGHDDNLRGVWELFTVDVTALRDDAARMRVVADGNEVFNKALTVANSTLYASDGTTPLAFYAGRYAVRIPVRFLNTTATTRYAVSYRIRQKGKVGIDVPAFTMNGPVSHGALEDDASYDSLIDGATVTGVAADGGTKVVTLTSAVTAQELYNYLSYWLSLNLSADSFVTLAGTTITLSDGWTLAGDNFLTGTIIDSAADSALSFDGIDSWALYSTSTDRDTSSNLVASGTGSQNFRFNFVASTTYYLRLTASGEISFRDITPTEAGNTVVSLTQASLLAAILASLGEQSDTATTRHTALIAEHDATQASIAALPAPLDAAGIRAAVGLAAANLDTQLSTIDGNAATRHTADIAEHDATQAAIAALPAPLDAAGTRAALGMAAADLDAQLDAVETNAALRQTALITEHNSTQTAIAALPAPLDAAGTRAALGLAAANLDTQLGAIPDEQLASVVEGSVTMAQAMRLLLASQYGDTSGMDTTTGTIKALDGATTRATAELDGNGNRTVSLVSLD